MDVCAGAQKLPIGIFCLSEFNTTVVPYVCYMSDGNCHRSKLQAGFPVRQRRLHVTDNAYLNVS